MSTTQDLTDALEEVTKLLEGYHKRDLPSLSLDGLRDCHVCKAIGKAKAALAKAGQDET